jgi:hypothetical protein
MTIKELTEVLNKYPPETPIYIYDSEYGAEEANGVEVDEHQPLWIGPKLTYITVVVIK